MVSEPVPGAENMGLPLVLLPFAPLYMNCWPIILPML